MVRRSIWQNAGSGQPCDLFNFFDNDTSLQQNTLTTHPHTHTHTQTYIHTHTHRYGYKCQQQTCTRARSRQYLTAAGQYCRVAVWVRSNQKHGSSRPGHENGNKWKSYIRPRMDRESEGGAGIETAERRLPGLCNDLPLASAL